MMLPLPPGPPPRVGERAHVGEIDRFTDRIDVRSPAEFAEDHLPGAINLPILDDAERARVGTMYVQVSAFEARRMGAAIASRNIARMLETYAADKPREWRPLVYCWRGGQRSRAVAHVFSEVGWRAAQLEGGYRAYRRHVIAQLATVPQRFDYRVICGLTGSGKSRLLRALAAAGAQVLDLETLAKHRGSLLGDLPGDPQPSQKWFESQLLEALQRLDVARPVYVESESKRIGTVQLPEALLVTMREASCVRVDTPRALRVALLKDEYAHFLGDSGALSGRLAPLTEIVGRKTLARWIELAGADQHDALVAELLDRHYDPLYLRSIDRNFPRHVDAIVASVDAISQSDFAALANELIARENAMAETT
ncbi:MAG TPA: tRNA 2-selenouridine(34) synthase MnmH [Casimicrobiaceae bacterium]|nr:tRNA 2-selenouridine(34) synthase MnmH [Casimicrobiaceae bacterium]